jgi:hypothetical protein
MSNPELEPQATHNTDKVQRGPDWNLYTQNPGIIEDAIARKAWKEAYEEFIDELESEGRDFDITPIPTDSLNRKTEL